jgi:CHAT domain-containing protein
VDQGRLAGLCRAAGSREPAAERAALEVASGADPDLATAGLADLPAGGGDGAYRCPQLLCDRRESTGLYCDVFLEPLVESPWRLAIVAGEPGAERDAVLARCLREAPPPVVTVDDPAEPGGTLVVELTGDLEAGCLAVERLLEAGRTVVVVTPFRLPGLPYRFARWPAHILRAGRVRRNTPGARTDLEGAREVTQPSGRVVNIAVADGAGRAVTGGVPLRLPYLVRVGVGRRRPESILSPDAPAFPDDLMPADPDGWWLDAVLTGGDAVVAQGALFLPRTGEGFACACTPGEPHTCAESDRSPWLDLVAVAPRSAGTQKLQLALYFGNAAVQAFEIDVPAGPDSASPAGRVVFTLSKDLADPGRLGGRDVSIRLGDLDADRQYLVVNDAGGARLSPPIADAQAGEAARGLRAVLFDRQLSEAGGKWHTLYDASFGKPVKDYVADLWAMARAGADVYLAMFPRVTDRDKLAAALAASDGPGLVQVALAEGSRAVVPWQLVYSLPILDNAGLCPSVTEFGPGTAGTPVPDRCPHAAGHDRPGGILCPYGFWGLAHVLEVPPSSGAMTLAASTGTTRPPTVVAGLNPQLAGAAWDRQRAALDRLGTASVVATDVTALRQAVVGGADLLFLFCHGQHVTGAGTAGGGLALDFGAGGRLLPADVSYWAELSPRVRWEQRRPLVVLNGCYTGERLPETLTDFATAFVQSTGAAGVLATEVTMEKDLAAYAMSAFVTAWGTGLGVGEAMRRVRWQLLALGNVMGLAYSPYCDADLRLPRS